MDRIELAYRRFTFIVSCVLLIGMAVVITASTIELIYGLIVDLIEPPGLLLGLDELYDTFGLFLLVLLAIELMSSVFHYLKDETLHLEIMFVIAITAITRKVIVTDIKDLDPMFTIGLALLVAALSWGYVQVIRERRESQ